MFTTVHTVAFSQELVFRETKKFGFYFEHRNPNYAPLYSVLENCPQDAFIKYHAEVQVEIFQQNGTYSIVLKSFTKNVECPYKYKNFIVGDFIFANKIIFQAAVRANGMSMVEINLENKEIYGSEIIFDTNIISDFEFSDFEFSISKIEYRLDEKGFEHFYQGIRRIDNYFLSDSLFNDWHKQVNLLDLSNVDMLPIYQFRLKDIELEIKRYDSNEYEVLLSKSGLDNRDYLQKRAILFKKIEDFILELSQKIAVMDDLMFEKAKQFEKEQNIEKAIFYYNRTLDYNPSHCDALERLSDLYTRQNLYKENLELFTSLRMRGEDLSCESILTSSVCDSICTKISNLIEQKNYYDAVKSLDTLELMFNQMSGGACMQTYLHLRKQAQDGIYSSYLEVINRGIKGNKIDLCKEYIYGLVAIMEKDKNLPSDNQFFMQMMDRFIFRYKENVKNLIKRKKHEEVIRNNDAMIVFLDSINHTKEEEEFLDSYSISCSEIYHQKKKQSEEDATVFFDIYGKYITLSPDAISENQKNFEQELNDENKYKFLVNYVLAWMILADDFSMLDYISALLQWEKEKEYTTSAIDSFFIEKRVIPLITNALSKINHHAWTNEFSPATVLIKKVEDVVVLLDLSNKTSEIPDKYRQTTELLQQRINERAEQEFITLSLKIKQLTKEKQYFRAYQLLKNENLYLQKTIYQKQINHLLEEVELPAVFQEKMLSVEQNIALEEFTSAFNEYEASYLYFLENNLFQYGLTCDDLHTFIKTFRRENLLKSACNYYLSSANHATALDLMMYLTDLGYKSNDIQAKIGLEMRKSSYLFSDISEKYTFTKVHKVFLEKFLGKIGCFWYFLKLKTVE